MGVEGEVGKPVSARKPSTQNGIFAPSQSNVHREPYCVHVHAKQPCIACTSDVGRPERDGAFHKTRTKRKNPSRLGTAKDQPYLTGYKKRSGKTIITRKTFGKPLDRRKALESMKDGENMPLPLAHAHKGEREAENLDQ